MSLKEGDEKWHTCMVVCDGATEWKTVGEIKGKEKHGLNQSYHI